jgi:hypothetical protein
MLFPRIGGRGSQMAKIEGCRRMSIEPPPNWYLHAAALKILRGESVELPIAPEAEPANVHSIAAARTRRAIREMVRRRGEL